MVILPKFGLTDIFILLLGEQGDLLVLSLPIIGEPTRDLLLLEACELDEACLLLFFEVWMLDVVEEPLL